MILDAVPPAAIVLVILGLSVAAPAISRACGRAGVWVLTAFPAAAFVVFLIDAGAIFGGQTYRSAIPWAGELGLVWDVWVSPLGLLLALGVCGIGGLITLYGGEYLKESPRRDRFFGHLFLFMGAMLGIAVTENLLVLFVFWELTSVASYLLIGFYHEKPESRKSALDALLTTAGGGLALLAGIIMLGEMAGSYRIGRLVESHDLIIDHAWYPAAFLCVLLGAATKSAQVPFHYWLPGAMTAPAPVSAYLHSATMVKAGVFLLALLNPVLGGTPLWHFTLLGLGAVTMTWAAVVAATQTDLKRVLAFSTISALGTLVMLLGIDHDLAAKAVVVFLIVHAMYKAALFMVAGVVEKTTGVRDVSSLRGLIRSMPLLGVAAVLAAASMSGLPPFIGFIAKELLYEVKVETPLVGWWLLLFGLVANAANIVVAANVGFRPFFSMHEPATPLKQRPSFLLSLGPAVLGLGSLLFGIFPQALGSTVTGVSQQIGGMPLEIKLKLWHGFNLVLLLSAATILLGVIGYLLRRQLWRAGRWFADDLGCSAQRVFRAALAGFVWCCDWVTRVYQSGDLKRYFATIMVAVVALLAGAWLNAGYELSFAGKAAWRLEVLVAVALIAASALALVPVKRRMTAVILLGCVGFGISALFALYGAPDLAITQLLVETLMLVLFALAIRGLPKIEFAPVGLPERVGGVVLAGALGVSFFLLTLKAMDVQWHEPVANQIAQRSVPDGFGRNIVNVILVDFRALDTMGEISVLLIAALGVGAMLGAVGARPVLISRARRSPVLAASARYTTPAMLVLSVYLLLRGHNDPGGGFIGGMVAALASVLGNLARPDRALTLLGLRPARLATMGLLLAGLSGLPGLAFDASFLDAVWGPALNLPLVGTVKLGTPLLFDIGVFGVVAGIVLLLYGRMEASHVGHVAPSRQPRLGVTAHG